MTIEYFVAQLAAQLAWPSYDIARFDISALGAVRCGEFIDPATRVSYGYVCSPLHAVMNTGFAALGVLTIAGVVLTWPRWPRLRSVRTGLALLAIGGVGSFLAGIAPGDVNAAVHGVGGLLHWLGAATGLFFLAAGLRRSAPTLALLALLCGLMWLAGFFLYGSQQDLGLGRGWIQRAMTYPLTVWLICCGVFKLRELKVTP